MAPILLSSVPPAPFLPPQSSSFSPGSRPARPLVMVKASIEPSKTASISTSTDEKSDPAAFSAPPSFTPAKPEPFGVKSDKRLDVYSAALGMLIRLATGVFVSGYSRTSVPADEIPAGQYALKFGDRAFKETAKTGPRPEKPIEIYEFESCPYCRKVREIVSVLDLDVLFYPCPKKAPNFRPKVARLGGKQQFPYMVDPNTGVSMYESDEIIKYLAQKYGDGDVPLTLSLGFVTNLSATLAVIPRVQKGFSYVPSKLPPKPLELWAYEGSPFAKLVREVLVELELPHIQHSCARGSLKRQAVFKKLGHFQVPYLEDPNTGVQMFESQDIIEYLKATYAA